MYTAKKQRDRERERGRGRGRGRGISIQYISTMFESVQLDPYGTCPEFPNDPTISCASIASTSVSVGPLPGGLMSLRAAVQESFANLDGVHCALGNSAERDFHPQPTAEFLCRSVTDDIVCIT